MTCFGNINTPSMLVFLEIMSLIGMVYSNDGLGGIATYWDIVYCCVVAIFYGWDAFDINALFIGEVLYGMAGYLGHFLCNWLVVHQVKTKIAHDMESTKFQDTELLNFIHWKLRIQRKVAVGGRPAATCWMAGYSSSPFLSATCRRKWRSRRLTRVRRVRRVRSSS